MRAIPIYCHSEEYNLIQSKIFIESPNAFQLASIRLRVRFPETFPAEQLPHRNFCTQYLVPFKMIFCACMVYDTNISQICSPLILVFRLDIQNIVLESEICLFFQCLAFRVYKLLFVFLCPILVSFIHSCTPLFIKEEMEFVKFLQKRGTV